MTTSIKKYSNFVFNISLKKKNSIIMPSLILVFSFIIGLIFKFLISPKYLELASFIYIFIATITTVIFSSLKAINIFKDMELEGMELISLSKPISRNKLVCGKLLALTYFGLIWSSVLFISALVSLYAVYPNSNLLLVSFLFFITGFSTYMTISLITALISYKLSAKIAITIPLALFVPFSLGGVLLAANATSNVNNAAYFINKKANNKVSGNISNTELFYLNNHKDELYIIPNGVDNKHFSNGQKKYLETVMNIANKSSKEWQIYSWLMLPYQFIDIFNIKNTNVFASISRNRFSNLDNYVYYPNLDNISYDYKLGDSLSLKKYKTSNNESKFIVPGIIKTNSVIDNKGNSYIVYAREKADDPNVEFPEDDENFSASPLAGKLKWEYVYQLLRSNEFNEIAAKYVNDFEAKNKELISSKNLININNKLMEDISAYINNKDSQIYSIENPNITLFQKDAIKNKLLASEIKRKIYFGISILNYIYFNKNDTILYEAMLKNPKTSNTYGDYQIKLKIQGFNYLIGGYASVDSIQTTKSVEIETNGKIEKKDIVINRYVLDEDKNNFLFQSSEVLSISRNKKIVNKNFYFLIWGTIIAILLIGVFKLYTKKDYR